MIYNLIDIQDNLDSYDKYHKILPMMNKQIPATSEICKGDHSYNGAITDWDNVGKTANKIVAFHDIYAHEGLCSYSWNIPVISCINIL